MCWGSGGINVGTFSYIDVSQHIAIIRTHIAYLHSLIHLCTHSQDFHSARSGCAWGSSSLSELSASSPYSVECDAGTSASCDASRMLAALCIFKIQHDALKTQLASNF